MYLGKTAYYADFVLAPASIVVLAFAAPIPSSLAGLGAFAGWIAAGVVAWSLLEYLVHRHLYHRVPFFKDIHDAHHADPKALIGAPPVIGLALIMALFYVPALGFGYGAASGFAIGGLSGYLAYMFLHHAAHHWTPAAGSWLWLARRHHALHHHAAEEGNFGIVTALWDHVFGTAVSAGRRPRRPSVRLLW